MGRKSSTQSTERKNETTKEHRRRRREREREMLTVYGGAEVHRDTVVSVASHSASPDLDNVGSGSPQSLHTG